MERAAWLGNDETHYVRKWPEKDVKDLKSLNRIIRIKSGSVLGQRSQTGSRDDLPGEILRRLDLGVKRYEQTGIRRAVVGTVQRHVAAAVGSGDFTAIAATMPSNQYSTTATITCA